MTTATITTRLLRGFDDPSFGPVEWNRLSATGQSDVVFMTWSWQSAWWDVFGRGRLLLIAVERDGEVAALAPLFSEAGMVYFVGAGGSDYLDFVGDISDEHVLDALLVEARGHVADFIGFVFHHVPDTSTTGRRLEQAAGRLGLRIFDEGSQPSPALEIGSDGMVAVEAAKKKSLVRHEKLFTRVAPLSVEHLSDGDAILPHLDEFFAQHLARWAGTSSPSLFNEERQRRFYREVARRAGQSGWLRFTRIGWQGRAIAFHFGFRHRGIFLWYKPSFAIELAKQSPGEVLLRHLLLASAAEGTHTFDFGLGDEAFKWRFATRVDVVRNWGLYEPGAVADKTPAELP